ncbi:MAG TPA: nuclear transport factor 2 family protein [Rhizorhapis sp.]
MTLTLQEMSDRFEIQDLLVAYCYAVDNQDFDALDHVFAPGAIIDYSEMVGVKGQLPEIKAFLKESLGSVKAFLHSVSTTQYTIDGDTARTRTAVYNPMEIDSNGTPSVMVFNLWYHHEFVRTEQGWRISSLREQACISENVPDWVKALTK